MNIRHCNAAALCPLTFRSAQPKPKSQKEVERSAMLNAPDPDARIAAVENLLSKFADTEFKALPCRSPPLPRSRRTTSKRWSSTPSGPLKPIRRTSGDVDAGGAVSRSVRVSSTSTEKRSSPRGKLRELGNRIYEGRPETGLDIRKPTGKRPRRTIIAQGYEALGQVAMVRKNIRCRRAVEAALDASTGPGYDGPAGGGLQPREETGSGDRCSRQAECDAGCPSGGEVVAAKERNIAVKLKGGAAPLRQPATGDSGAARPGASDGASSRPESTMSAADLQELEAKLGHTFRDRDLLVRALTHRSYPFGRSDQPSTLDNERLEFLGDSILGFLISECLVFPLISAWPEGRLSKVKAHLVSATHLHRVAQRLSLGIFFISVAAKRWAEAGRRKCCLRTRWRRLLPRSISMGAWMSPASS